VSYFTLGQCGFVGQFSTTKSYVGEANVHSIKTELRSSHPDFCGSYHGRSTKCESQPKGSFRLTSRERMYWLAGIDQVVCEARG